MLESRTPNGTPGGTPVASPEKRAPKSPNKMAAARKDVVGVQCFKCQAWFESADDTYLIHVGECDAEVNLVEIINWSSVFFLISHRENVQKKMSNEVPLKRYQKR